ncbi:MAG TPA: hypothetical protein DCE42_15145, partial [Myxococcales bacterium]|nr:hypothetical protein [Myxococcales bacterium]
MELTIKDTSFTIVGKLQRMRKSRVWSKLQNGGGQLMATLAQSTDVLVIGDTYFEEEARKYTERAELNGTIVINEVQFEDLLEHGHLHIEEKASPIGESIELTESIAHIRSLLGDAPTVETWQQLYQVLDKTPKSNLPDVVEYVLAHFSQHTPNWSDAG